MRHCKRGNTERISFRSCAFAAVNELRGSRRFSPLVHITVTSSSTFFIPPSFSPFDTTATASDAHEFFGLRLAQDDATGCSLPDHGNPYLGMQRSM